jgi:hypothetical protein
MIAYLENPFGFGKYHITGKNCEKAKSEFEKLVEELNETMSMGSFTMEFQMYDGLNTIIKNVSEKYNVEFELII